MIDEYTVDKQKAPESLQTLVIEGYLRQVPQDPITNSDTTWRVIMEDNADRGKQQFSWHLRRARAVRRKTRLKALRTRTGRT